mmetsp:Transcript_8671/g.22314  ORF Transcript_8671/g.22314 Transcript_8671/m.22314 type:complete len:140 (+) Transcript_8671:48-467(+)
MTTSGADRSSNNWQRPAGQLLLQQVLPLPASQAYAVGFSHKESPVSVFQKYGIWYSSLQCSSHGCGSPCSDFGGGATGCAACRPTGVRDLSPAAAPLCNIVTGAPLPVPFTVCCIVANGLAAIPCAGLDGTSPDQADGV